MQKYIFTYKTEDIRNTAWETVARLESRPDFDIEDFGDIEDTGLYVVCPSEQLEDIKDEIAWRTLRYV